MLNPLNPYVKILSRYIHKAIASIHVSTEDKERLAEAVGWLETFPFYLVSITDEDLDALRRDVDNWNMEKVYPEERRTRRFRMRELTNEARYRDEYNRVLGIYRSAQTDAGEPRYNLNEAKALAAQDRLVKRYHKWWLWCKACRKESKIIAKAYADTSKSLGRAYHLAKDKAEGKLVAATGG